MKDQSVSSFSNLYRAAFAEPDPETKLLLLAEVKRAIDEWEQKQNRFAVSVSPVADLPGMSSSTLSQAA